MRGRNDAHSASVSTGRVESGADLVPWTVRVHSQTTSTSAPASLRHCRSACAAANSASASRSSRKVEYQPEMNTSPYSASLAFNSGAVLGILLPFSIPSRPISRASLRHCSSGMSPPISIMSSFDQQMGLAPMRIILGLQFARFPPFASTRVGGVRALYGLFHPYYLSFRIQVLFCRVLLFSATATAIAAARVIVAARVLNPSKSASTISNQSLVL